MAESPQWLTAGQISINCPHPSIADINVAARAIPDLILSFGTGKDETHSIPTQMLIGKLRSGGFSRDTAEWSIYTLIKEEFLRPATAPKVIVSPSAKYGIDEIVVVSSEPLWRWWRDQMPGCTVSEKRLTTTIVSEYDPVATSKAYIAVLKATWPEPESNEIFDPQEKLDMLWAYMLKVPNIRLPDFPVISYPSPVKLWLNNIKKEVLVQVKQAWRDFHQALGIASAALAEAATPLPSEEQSGGSSTSSGGKNRKRGRPRKDQAKHHNEKRVAADWKRANNAGVSKAEFAAGLDMSGREFNRLLDRVRK